MTELSLLTSAVRSAMMRAADQAVMPFYRRLQDCDIREKEADEKVTAADERSEEILNEELSRLISGAMIVGEELAAKEPAVLERLSGATCWIIDPLDGTNNFAAGREPFGIMVALAEGGEPVGGWILDPASGRFYHATRGGGAWFEGQPVRSRRSTGPLPVLSVSSLYADKVEQSRLAHHCASRFAHAPMPRCAAAQYPAIALGQNDVTLFGRTLPWDHAAGVIFLNESGGRAARLDGSQYRVDDPQPNMIAAASPALWDEFSALLHELTDTAKSGFSDRQRGICGIRP
jgi:fructose-1,6-bisphosphatase/inositol monophosphatase family enzyme